jgi:hypothetical protein
VERFSTVDSLSTGSRLNDGTALPGLTPGHRALNEEHLENWYVTHLLSKNYIVSKINRVNENQVMEITLAISRGEAP